MTHLRSQTERLIPQVQHSIELLPRALRRKVWALAELSRARVPVEDRSARPAAEVAAASEVEDAAGAVDVKSDAKL